MFCSWCHRFRHRLTCVWWCGLNLKWDLTTFCGADSPEYDLCAFDNAKVQNKLMPRPCQNSISLNLQQDSWVRAPFIITEKYPAALAAILMTPRCHILKSLASPFAVTGIQYTPCNAKNKSMSDKICVKCNKQIYWFTFQRAIRRQNARSQVGIPRSSA